MIIYIPLITWKSSAKTTHSYICKFGYFIKATECQNYKIYIWLCIVCMTQFSSLTHWGRVTHICVSDLTSIDSDNGLSPGRRQAIIWTNAGILLIRPLGTYFSEFLVEILIFSFKIMRLKASSAKRRPFCLGLNELKNGVPEPTVKAKIIMQIIKCIQLLRI